MGRKYRVLTYSGSVYDVEVDEEDDEISIKLSGVGEDIRVKVGRVDDNRFVVSMGSRKYSIVLQDENILVDNEPALINKVVELLPIASTVKTGGEKKTVVARKGEIRAPLSGRVAEIKVEKGDRVKVGDVVALMISMKMVVEIKSDVEGVVEEVLVKPEQVVKAGDIIMRIAVEEKEKR